MSPVKVLRQKLEFVLEENRVYRVLLERHSRHRRLQDAERKGLAEKGKLLGRLLQDLITRRFLNQFRVVNCL